MYYFIFRKRNNSFLDIHKAGVCKSIFLLSFIPLLLSLIYILNIIPIMTNDYNFNLHMCRIYVQRYLHGEMCIDDLVLSLCNCLRSPEKVYRYVIRSSRFDVRLKIRVIAVLNKILDYVEEKR